MNDYCFEWDPYSLCFMDDPTADYSISAHVSARVPEQMFNPGIKRTSNISILNKQTRLWNWFGETRQWHLAMFGPPPD